jgi:thymidine kinase
MLSFYYGSVNSGKSTLLIQMARDYRRRGLTPILLVPAICGTECITSRLGDTEAAHVFAENKRLVEFLDSPKFTVITCLMIDDSQFMTVSQVHELNIFSAKFRIPIYCFGIRTDFKGEPFPSSAALLLIADELKQVTAFCSCDSVATMTACMDGLGNTLLDGRTIHIGNRSYILLCRMHWLRLAGAIR